MMINPRLFFAALWLALLLTAGLAVTARPALSASTDIVLSEENQTSLTQINAYINALRSVKGRFTQVGPNGEFTEGAFYLARPGRIRFDYVEPNPILVVADGFWVGIEDRKLKTVEKYPLSATPLRLLLADNVNLAKDARIVDFKVQDDQYDLTLEDPRGIAPGQLTLIFGGPAMTLKQWVVTDAQGLRTEVTLFDMVTDAALSKKLFFIDDSSLYGSDNKY